MISLSKAPKTVKQEGNVGVFEIEALYPGYGVTVGNSLRRVLLSSLEGAAATQVKVKGVPHEFSTIPGVLEDVIEVLLNLKQLRFKMFSNDPQAAVLKVKGEKKITGADFKLSSEVELENPQAHIATLTAASATLELELVIEKGVGYVAAEQRKSSKQEIGSVLLDAIFTPVQRVSYEVSKMRVGDRTDFDRLTLKIETDGTLSPETALYQATDILAQQFDILRAGLTPEEPAKKGGKKAASPKKKAASKTKKTAKKAAPKKK